MADVKLTLLKDNSFSVGTVDLEGYLNRPLYTSGCTVLICNGGSAVVSINFRKQVLRSRDVVFLFSDMVFIVVRASKGFSAFYCSVSNELLTESTYNTSWDFYGFLNINPICPTTEAEYTQLRLWQEQLMWFVSDEEQVRNYAFVRNSIQNLFLGVDREIKRSPDLLKLSQRKDRAWDLMNRFFALLVTHCQTIRSVAFYADKLCITPYYLYKVTNKILGMSPKDLIDEQIVVELKMYLTCTNMTVKEISARMCFDDPSYMCRFFRRYTGKSLTEYRAAFN